MTNAETSCRGVQLQGRHPQVVQHAVHMLEAAAKHRGLDVLKIAPEQLRSRAVFAQALARDGQRLLVQIQADDRFYGCASEQQELGRQPSQWATSSASTGT